MGCHSYDHCIFNVTLLREVQVNIDIIKYGVFITITPYMVLPGKVGFEIKMCHLGVNKSIRVKLSVYSSSTVVRDV